MRAEPYLLLGGPLPVACTVQSCCRCASLGAMPALHVQGQGPSGFLGTAAKKTGKAASKRHVLPVCPKICMCVTGQARLWVMPGAASLRPNLVPTAVFQRAPIARPITGKQAGRMGSCLLTLCTPSPALFDPVAVRVAAHAGNFTRPIHTQTFHWAEEDTMCNPQHKVPAQTNLTALALKLY